MKPTTRIEAEIISLLYSNSNRVKFENELVQHFNVYPSELIINSLESLVSSGCIVRMVDPRAIYPDCYVLPPAASETKVIEERLLEELEKRGDAKETELITSPCTRGESLRQVRMAISHLERDERIVRFTRNKQRYLTTREMWIARRLARERVIAKKRSQAAR